MRAPSTTRRFPASDGDPTLGPSLQWFAIAVGSLVIAGLFSLLLVLGRLPGLDALFTDPLFFKRGLVVHVDLSIVVWFYAFIAALFFLLPVNLAPTRLARNSAALACGGILLLIAAAGIPKAMPVLANYVPVIDHPLYVAGLIVFGVAVLAAVLQPSLFPAHDESEKRFDLAEAALPALRAAAVALVMAAMTFFAAFVSTSRLLSSDAYYEIVMWGGGHVLQFASVAAMLAIWLTLTTWLTGRTPISRRGAGWLFGFLVAPLLVAPLLAMGDTTGATYRRGFTWLMQLGIAPTVTITLILCARAFILAKREGGLVLSLRDSRFSGLVTSVALTCIGFGIGLRIDGSNTLVPAHYHANIGAVTVAFMAITYPLLKTYGMPLWSTRVRRFAGWQPLLFGVGQMTFAIGFAVAGAYGMSRKTYAQEQVVNHVAQKTGLIVMGLGGLVAVVGGLLYLGIVIGAWRKRAHPVNAHHKSLEGARA